MALSLGGLTAFTNEDELKMLVPVLYEAPSAQLINAGNAIVKGIKYAKALPVLTTTIYAQDGTACGFTASGDAAITQRVITVANPKFQDSYCPKDLEPYFTQKGLSPGNPEDLGVFQTDIAGHIGEQIQEWVEIRIWQGDASNTGEWDGFKTLLDDAGFGGASDPVEANATGNGYTAITAATGITIANISTGTAAGILEQIQVKLPAKIRSASITKKDVVAFCGTDTFQKAVLNLAARNLFHFMPPDGATSHQFPGCTYKLVAVPGLDGTNVIITGKLTNFFLGTDLLNEEENFEIWWSQDDRLVKWNVDFKYGAQFAFLNEVTYWKGTA